MTFLLRFLERMSRLLSPSTCTCRLLVLMRISYLLPDSSDADRRVNRGRPAVGRFLPPGGSSQVVRVQFLPVDLW